MRRELGLNPKSKTANRTWRGAWGAWAREGVCGAGREEVVGVGAEKPPAWAVDQKEWGAMGPGAMGP